MRKSRLADKSHICHQCPFCVSVSFLSDGSVYRTSLFLQDDFDVDQFVSECRKQVQLEEMREDLELYYKLLKTAMVELINKDYADFVNLSTNLVSCYCINI